MTFKGDLIKQSKNMYSFTFPVTNGFMRNMQDEPWIMDYLSNPWMNIFHPVMDGIDNIFVLIDDMNDKDRALFF